VPATYWIAPTLTGSAIPIYLGVAGQNGATISEDLTSGFVYMLFTDGL